MLHNRRRFLAESAETFVGFRGHVDQDKGTDVITHQGVVDFGMESLDHSRVLQTVNPLGDCRRSKPDLLSDLAGRRFAVCLQNVDDFNICVVHEAPSLADDL